MVDGMRWVWKHWLKPVWDEIKDKALPQLEGAFDGTMRAIKSIWEGLKRIVGAPIKFVLDTVINNGLIDGFNKVANWVGEDGFKHIPIPAAIQKYATGGVLPGYTPGRDVHSFVSPTAGRLELSGGEAIMRPEFTAAVGTGFVDTYNHIARTSGVEGVRRALGFADGGVIQRFARGGVVFPVRGGYVNRSSYNLSHNGMDINHPNDASGRVPFVSATSGRVTTTGYDRGYGNAVFVASPYGELVYGHALDGSIGVRPGQSVSPGQYLAMIGNTGNSTGPHLHFGKSSGGSFAAMEAILAGSVQPGKVDGKPARSAPGWLMDIVRNPLGAVKGWVTGMWDKASNFMEDSPVFKYVKQVPLAAAKKVTDQVWDIVPGWAKTAVGWAGDAAGWAIGGVKNAGELAGDVVGGVGDFLGLKDGGILPYNGTMKYDDGGYLPPGLTTVMNLTGKPEPVFTDGQWSEMGGGAGGGNIHYEPHFEGSDLTAEDVAGDLNFTFRRIKRGGKYEGAGRP